MRLIFLSILATFLISCTPIQQSSISQSKVNTIILDDGFGNCANSWLYEARQYFDNPMIVMGHGLNQKGPWMQVNEKGQQISVTALAMAMRQIYPDRDIILIICNPDHQDLYLPRVYYAKGFVWTLPDNFTPIGLIHETQKGNNDIGSIDEFYCQGKLMSVTKKPNK